MKGHTMWKKIIAGVVGFVLLLLGVAIALPFLFKDRIFERLKAEVEARVTARIDFGDFDLTLFSHFPDLTLRIEQIEVHGVGKFEGTTLADIGAVEATIDLGSLLRRPIAVKRIGIVAPKFHVVILEDGSANYDIAVPVGKEAPQGEAPPQPRGKSEGGKELRIALREYFIEDAEVTYEDRPGALYAHIEHFTHRGSGDLSQALVLLRTKTVIGAVTLRSGGIPYLKRTRIEGKFDLRLDLEKKRYAFDENELRLNDFVLGFDGAVALRNDGALDLDVTWKTRRTDFKQILSLVPAVYTQNFANLETAGTVQLEGFAKGILQGEQLPAFGLDLRVADGMFHDPKLPSRVEGVAAKLHVENGGGSADETTVALERFHLEIAKNPVDLKFVLRHPVSDPEIDATLLAHLDLARLGEVIPLKEGESFGGRIDADVTLAGKLSTLQAGRYDAFQADGKVELAGVSYTGPTLPLPLLVEKGRLAFSPKFLELSPFDAKIGHSDLHLTGRIDNYLPFALRDETLRGNFTLTSTLLDVTPFMTGEKETEKAPLSVIEVPRNIDAVFRTRIDTLRAGGIEMTKVRGKVVVRDGVADLHDLGLKIFGGTLLVTGKYDTREPRNPRFDFGLDLKRIDLPTLWQQVETVQKIAPVARNSSGKFSTKLRVTGLLDPQMAPRLDTLTGGGSLFTERVTIESSGTLAKLADQLKIEDLEKLKLYNTRITYAFEEGRVKIKPFRFKSGGIAAEVSGSHGFDQSLDYRLALDVPTAALGNAADMLANLLGDLGSKIPKRVQFDILISGTMKEPHFKITPKGRAGGAGAAARAKVSEEIDRAKRTAEKRAQEEIERAKAKGEAEAKRAKKAAEDRIAKEAKKIRDRAEKEAKRVRRASKKAAEKVRKDGYAAAEKVEAQAKDPFSKAAAKATADRMRKEADKKADQILREGEKKADRILREAEAKIEQLQNAS